MEAIYSPKKSVNFHWTKQCYIPESRTAYNHPCENLRRTNLQVIYKLTSLDSIDVQTGYEVMHIFFIINGN
jgi:hypothetical protein